MEAGQVIRRHKTSCFSVNASQKFLSRNDTTVVNAADRGGGRAETFGEVSHRKTFADQKVAEVHIAAF